MSVVLGQRSIIAFSTVKRLRLGRQKFFHQVSQRTIEHSRKGAETLTIKRDHKSGSQVTSGLAEGCLKKGG